MLRNVLIDLLIFLAVFFVGLLILRLVLTVYLLQHPDVVMNLGEQLLNSSSVQNMQTSIMNAASTIY